MEVQVSRIRQMKIRSRFVSNSSTSSYIALGASIPSDMTDEELRDQIIRKVGLKEEFDKLMEEATEKTRKWCQSRGKEVSDNLRESDAIGSWYQLEERIAKGISKKLREVRISPEGVEGKVLFIIQREVHGEGFTEYGSIPVDEFSNISNEIAELMGVDPTEVKLYWGTLPC